MKNNIKLLRGVKNATYLAIGNLITQVITFVGFIYIARMLGPNNYGIYVTVGAFVGMFDILLLVGLDKTVLREGSKNVSSMHIYFEKTICLRNSLILVAIVVCIFCSFLTPYEFQTKLYIILFSSQLLYNGYRGYLGTIYQAAEKMHYISIFGITNRILFVSLSITFLHYGFGLLTLFLIALFSNLSSLLLSYKYTRQFVEFNIFSKIQIDKNLLKPAIIFSLIVFVGFLVQRIDLLMISFLGTANDVGIYGVAYKIAAQGEMLRNVIATAFFPIFVKRFQNSKMKGSMLIKYSIFFLCGILVLSLTASFFVEDVITFLFGSEYKSSGGILRVLMFYVSFTWATLPLTTAAQATNNEKYLLKVLLIKAAINIPLNYIFFLKFGIIGIAYSTLIVFAIGSYFYSIIISRIMKKQGHLI